MNGGKELLVEWKTREKYVNLTLNFRLNEYNNQIEAVKKGIGEYNSFFLRSTFSF